MRLIAMTDDGYRNTLVNLFLSEIRSSEEV